MEHKKEVLLKKGERQLEMILNPHALKKQHGDLA